MTGLIYDVAIVGAGAAGLMAAVQAARLSLNILLLDGQTKIGAKILMSGGTRCNVTNQQVTEKDFASDYMLHVRNILRAFPPERTIQFFEELGVALAAEDNGKFFPSTHSGRTVLDAFLNAIKANHIPLKTSCKVNTVSFDKGIFDLRGVNFKEQSRTVILTTGGLSYPKTGSDGSGYGIAKAFGHTLIPTMPALTPLLLDDADWKTLSGVSLPARLTLLSRDEKQITFDGPLLFTHFGLSGPAALNISRHWLRAKKSGSAELAANFLPDKTREQFTNILETVSGKYPDRSLKRLFAEFVPERFADILQMKCGIPKSRNLNQLAKREKQQLVKNLFEFTFEIADVFGYQKAEATAGGVRLNDIDYRTMESKCQPGLFLAGEILDADGRIGGFNFQWAWATGFLAAQGVRQYLKQAS